MSRLKLKRFRVKKPNDAALARYLRAYSSKDLYWNPDALPPLSSRELFDADAPLVFDLGCGRGEFLVRQAQGQPDLYFVGFDWHRKSIWDAINRAEAAGLDNVKFVRADFRRALAKVPDQSVQDVFLLFPPPILKHSKRKQDPLPDATIRAIHRVLLPAGVFHFVTDRADYFAVKVARLDASGLFARLQTSHEFEGGLTRFQRFWEGFDIESHRYEGQKQEPPPETKHEAVRAASSSSSQGPEWGRAMID
jgi:tRNA (guanine-N7-)-methyltransferase